MKLSKLFTLTIATLTMSWSAQAQDIHFSQFGMSNLTLNPATTGVMSCNARVSVIYRNQWAAATENPFNTFGVGGEAKFNAGKSDFWGLGVNLWADAAGASDFTTIQGSVSGSYLKKLGGRRSKDHFLVAGAQIGFLQRSINLNDLRWGTDWNGNAYDPSISFNGSEEIYRNNANNVNFDLSAGLMWFSSFGKDGKSNVYAGIGFQHLTKANLAFLADNGNRLQDQLWTKYTIHGGADIRVKRRLAIVPSFALWSQGPSFQMNLGSAVKFDFSKRAQSSQAFSVGLYLRGANQVIVGQEEGSFGVESLIPRIEMRFGSHRIGFAYDINISSLAAATNGNGAFELGYVWTLCGSSGRRLGCPTF